MTRTRSSFLAAILVTLIMAIAGFAQTQSGVTGVVTDQSGAVVPGVSVTLTDTRTGKDVNTVTTADDGTYKFTNVDPGQGYKLSFSRQGFQTLELTAVNVAVGSTETHNIQLTPGAVSAKVEVVSTSEGATLNTTDSTLGNVINERQLKELPIQIRGSPAALLGLQPGVVGSNLGTTSTNRVGSVTGSRADQGNITVDGIDANDQATGQAFSTVGNAPIDSIQEFRGTVAGFNASDGRSSGGQIQLKTNSGTNQFHGNLREYYRNEHVAANTFFNNKNGVKRPALRRHQYGGSIGGPLPMFNFGENNGPEFKSGKDKLFFFFDLENRRDRSQVTASRTVPLDTWRAGQIGYINNNAGCGASSRANTTPTCISYLTPAQIAGFDPQGVGDNAALLNLYNSRFPHANDLTLGDGINTGGFRWNAPSVRDDHIYTTRIDANPTDRQRIFGRFTITRRASTNSIQFLPQDADAVSLKDQSYGWVIGHTWIISPNFTNVATVGVTKSVLLFAPPSNQPSFPFSFAGGTIGAPFASLSYQDRHVSTPTYKDDITYIRGNHTIFAGASFKPIRQESSLINDFNFVSIGLVTGTATSALGPNQRPANLNGASTAISGYDQALASILGRIGSVTTNYNYTPSGTALKPGTGKLRNYAYNEYEFYGQDNWKIRSDLSLNLGLRYALYPAPYETNGLLAIDTTDPFALLKTRISNAAAGISGNSAEPFLVYQLAGKTNNGPSLYKTDKNNWAPRVAFNYNPSFKDGIMGKLFGDRKSVLHGSAGITYDRVSGAVLFIQNQVDYVFQNSAITNFGNVDPTTALLTDPRFTSVNSVPPPVVTVPPVVTKPFTPFVTGGVPNGEAAGAFNFTIDHNFKTPYSWVFDFGYQRELPGNHIIDVSYVGRLGRDLFVQSDVGQVMNFKDPASGQLLFNAFNTLTTERAACNGVTACLNTLTAIPFLENQVGAAALALRGKTCANVVAGAGITNCTSLVARLSAGTLIARGDSSDAVQSLNGSLLLFNGVGLGGQFASNAYITNQGRSDYHGMLVSVRKRYSRGLQYDINYTFSKSLDNNSTVANTVTGGLVCDVLNPDICRGPSDFDVRHIFNADFIYDLPIGRGKWLAGGSNKFVNSVIGGWTLSGILQGRSGLPFSPSPAAAAFPIGFELGSPAVITNLSAFKQQIHNDGTTIQYYADPSAANAALRDPLNGEFGQRNLLRGPSFWELDMGLSKKWSAPWSEKQRFTFRVDAFNVTNSNYFNAPGVTRVAGVTSLPAGTSFGTVTSSASSAREIQAAIRWDF